MIVLPDHLHQQAERINNVNNVKARLDENSQLKSATDQFIESEKLKSGEKRSGSSGVTDKITINREEIKDYSCPTCHSCV